jgi:voltage-gated potassium channel
MPTLKKIVEDHDTPLGLAFDVFIQALIVLMLVAYSLETLPNLSYESRAALEWFELLAISVFTVEYVLRLLVADNKLGFVFSFFGIIDLLAILPFYLALDFDLKSLRILRLLRLFLLFKLVRYSKAMRRFHRALVIAREELVLFTIIAAIFLYLAAVGIYQFENKAQPETFASVFHSLWWAVVTLTTVGYGDVYPITAGGKIFTFFVLLIGLSVIAVPAGVMATALAKAREVEEESSRPTVAGKSRSA